MRLLGGLYFLFQIVVHCRLVFDQAASMRQLGMEAMSNGDNEGAVKHFTAGILLDNSKTVLFVKRAT